MWGLDSGPWRGLMMWQDGEGNNPTATIDLTGQGAMDLAGTLYSPFGNVKIAGNGTSTATLTCRSSHGPWISVATVTCTCRTTRPSCTASLSEAWFTSRSGRLKRTCCRQAKRERHGLARVAGAVDARAAEALIGLDPP